MHKFSSAYMHAWNADGRDRFASSPTCMLMSPSCACDRLLVCTQVVKDKKVVQELPIAALKKVQVGRREDADWVIEHPSGSRQHACVPPCSSPPWISQTCVMRDAWCLC